MSSFRIIEGDCIEAMRGMDEASIDAIVCDPPYGLEFMGKEWDRLGAAALTDPSEVGGFQDGNGGNAFSRSRIRFGASARSMQEWHEAWATEALRVLRPGGHLLAFGGTRTYHRLACAIEDAGFEIRDCLAWLYGSGFPKSLDVSKAIDKAAGAEREVVGRTTHPDGRPRNLVERESGIYDGGHTANGVGLPVTAPATPEAAQWQGWGTALKPAHEPIVLARKPLTGTVAGNVLAHGTGALNVDGCRIEHASDDDLATSLAKNPGRDDAVTSGTYGADRPQQSVNVEGRWPANVILDPEAAALLDAQAGKLGTTTRKAQSYDSEVKAGLGGIEGQVSGYGDTGGASRFFYTAKASRAERNAGLEGFEKERKRRFGSGGRTRVEGEWVETHSEPIPSANVHPTVKPIALMRWLCRLVTPPGGTVLDPFTGSGTTGCAAVLEDFDFIGIERESEYVAIAEARVAHWAAQPKQLGLL